VRSFPIISSAVNRKKQHGNFLKPLLHQGGGMCVQ
jgi:hypothetical protein